MKMLRQSLTQFGLAIALASTLMASPAQTAAWSFIPACPAGMVVVATPTPGATPRGQCVISFGPFGLHLFFNLYQTAQRYEGVRIR